MTIYPPGPLFRKIRSRIDRQVFPLTARRAIATAGKLFPPSADSGFERFNPPLFAEERDAIASEISRDHRPWRESALRKADAVLGHTISILGKETPLGEKIDWQRDYESGHVWPLEPFQKIRETGTREGVDIKAPWEVSRFHHGIALGKAYALTKNEEYARELVSQITDWIEENPPYRGVNWTCPMEAAIRAVNFIWSMALVQGAAAVTPEVISLFHRTLFLHGVYLSSNIELNIRALDGRLASVNENHYVCDIVGLLYISLALRGTRKTRAWLSTALRGLAGIARDQICVDGVYYEFCPNYHRLVLEALLSAVRLLLRNGIEADPAIPHGVSGMIRHVEGYTKPNGGFPLVRDIDSGRFHIFGEEALNDHRHVVEWGKAVIGTGPFQGSPLFEDTLWLVPRSRRTPAPAAAGAGAGDAKQSSRAFTSGGFYVMRAENAYVFAVCSPMGMHGFCGHAHNDLLSFEYSAFGEDFITDSGSFVYTRYPKIRNAFRSTASHTTAVIDDREINELSAENMFSIRNDASPTVTEWKSDAENDVLKAEYSVQRLGSRVTHGRTFLFAKKDSRLDICDEFRGDGVHSIRIHFHFNTGLDAIAMPDGGYAVCGCTGTALMLIPSLPDGAVSEVGDGWVSKVYGKKEARRVVTFSIRPALPVKCLFTLAPVRSADGRPLTADWLRENYLKEKQRHCAM